MTLAQSVPATIRTNWISAKPTLRLISSAPDLYAALEALTDWHEWSLDYSERMADEFYRETSMMAPFKDRAAAAMSRRKGAPSRPRNGGSGAARKTTDSSPPPAPPSPARGVRMSLAVAPVTLAQAKAFVAQHHLTTSRRLVGSLACRSLTVTKSVGVATAGRAGGSRVR